MTWTLLRKELRQHGLALVLLGVLMVAGFGLLLAVTLASAESGSVFAGFRLFVLVIMTLGSLTLCHRLVVLEYAAKTQLFLEALPVARWRMVAVKYVLGLGVLLTALVLALLVTALIGQRSEALTRRFVGLLAVRAVSATVSAYHFFFLMGFLGRYRLALYLALGLAVMAVTEYTDLRLDRLGPIALLDEQFAFERKTVPWAALGQTWALSGVCLGLVVLLALTREGTVATLLAEEMSHREKVFIAALLVGVVFALSLLDQKVKRPPFDLHDAVTAERAGVVVKVAGGRSTETRASELAQRLADELAAVQAYLGVTNLPPVFVVQRGSLDANRFERGELENASGVHVRANFTGAGFREDDFLGWLLREVLITRSGGRATLESKRWVLDGFAPFFRTGEPSAPLAQDRTLALRALVGTEPGFTRADLGHWQRFREQVGDEIASGVAWSGLRALARRQGTEQTRELIRAVLGVNVPKGFRALLHERSTPLARLVPETAGVSFDVFWTWWLEDLDAARKELAPTLARLPRLRGEVTFAPLSAESRTVRYRVHLDRPPAGARYSFLHHELPFFDEEVKPQGIRRETHAWSQRSGGELPESLARGARLYWTFAVEVPELGCPIISGWRREEVP